MPFSSGKILDFDFKRMEKSQRIKTELPGAYREADLSQFPIEKARIRTSKFFIAACAPLIAGYGWCLQFRVVSTRH